MPFDVTQGSTVQFDVAFLDADGAITTPTSGTLTITYTTVGGSTASDTISLTQTGSFFTGTWGSGVAAQGMADFSVTAPGQATPSTGQLRIIS